MVGAHYVIRYTIPHRSEGISAANRSISLNKEYQIYPVYRFYPYCSRRQQFDYIIITVFGLNSGEISTSVNAHFAKPRSIFGVPVLLAIGPLSRSSALILHIHISSLNCHFGTHVRCEFLACAELFFLISSKLNCLGKSNDLNMVRIELPNMTVRITYRDHCRDVTQQNVKQIQMILNQNNYIHN